MSPKIKSPVKRKNSKHENYKSIHEEFRYLLAYATRIHALYPAVGVPWAFADGGGG
jgi:hypothetical protein